MPKILVADDNANIQKMVALSFEDRGIQVVTVGNGEAAVRRIPDLQPDLVLADIFMPVRNGYEVCEFVKKDERFSHVPVILLVGAFDPLDEKEARRVGADGVLKKPFVPPDPLIAMVMSALEKNPKIAAELAKAREAKQVAPPEPVSAPIPEPPNSVRAEIKPLPDFPEPTSPEEAALVYGFGTGRRALHEEQAESIEGPKAPAAEADEAAEDEFDGAATSHDWRRNAMDFDIPADAANKPAFAVDERLEPAMFPSERDVPPRHVRVPEPAEEAGAVIKDRVAAPAPAEAASPASVEQDSADSEIFAPAGMPGVVEAEPLSESTPVIESEPAPEPISQSAPAHWMDQLAQGSSDHAPSDWMSALSEQSAQRFVIASREPEHAEAIVPAEQPEEIVATEVDSHSDAAVEAPEASASVETHASDESFFADEPVASASSGSWLSPTPAAAVEEATREEVETTAAEAVPVAGSKSDEGFELESDTKPPLSYKDPDLVEPPAVHVTPEPLLVEEEPQAPSQYGARDQEVQPLHSFLVPASPEPAVEEPPAPEPSNSIEPSAAFFAPEPVMNERIPTGPPPNREALAEIPFLTPPPEFRAQMREPAATDPGTVDAVVQKVLEKLEPQLHDLLSQGVLKPLVENLLQSELSKKK